MACHYKHVGVGWLLDKAVREALVVQVLNSLWLALISFTNASYHSLVWALQNWDPMRVCCIFAVPVRATLGFSYWLVFSCSLVSNCLHACLSDSSRPMARANLIVVHEAGKVLFMLVLVPAHIQRFCLSHVFANVRQIRMMMKWLWCCLVGSNLTIRSLTWVSHLTLCSPRPASAEAMVPIIIPGSLSQPQPAWRRLWSRRPVPSGS